MKSYWVQAGSLVIGAVILQILLRVIGYRMGYTASQLEIEIPSVAINILLGISVVLMAIKHKVK